MVFLSFLRTKSKRQPMFATKIPGGNIKRWQTAAAEQRQWHRHYTQMAATIHFCTVESTLRPNSEFPFATLFFVVVGVVVAVLSAHWHCFVVSYSYGWLIVCSFFSPFCHSYSLVWLSKLNSFISTNTTTATHKNQGNNNTTTIHRSSSNSSSHNNERKWNFSFYSYPDLTRFHTNCIAKLPNKTYQIHINFTFEM